VIVSIETTSPVPVYEQIRAQVTALAASGALPAGTRLPSVRQLADDLGIAPGTVAKAYQHLEDNGVTKGHRRRGTLVTDHTTTTSQQDRRAALIAAAKSYAETARLLNIDTATATQVVTETLQPL
jgi:DNA-binding transcriptional regulator YhcF (GntR family)